MSTIPGLNARHAIITPACRANKSDMGAFEEAVARLRATYADCLPHNPAARFHVVLTIEQPVYRSAPEAEEAGTPSGGLLPKNDRSADEV